MKTQSKPTQGRTLPKRNDRWQWMAGATAASAATAASSHAAVVQINLIDNQLSIHGGAYTLDADLTGNGQGDITLSGTYENWTPVDITPDGETGSRFAESVKVNMVKLGAFYHAGGASILFSRKIPPGSTATVGASVKMDDPSPLFGLIPVKFTDSKFNGGALTNARLDVSARGFTSVNPTTDSPQIRLMRLVFDDADPTSTLGGVVAGGTNTQVGSTQAGFFAGVKNDFNLDGSPDLLWQNVSNGRLAVWLMNGISILSEQNLGVESNTAWQIVGTGVFSSSGYNDLLWQNTSTGDVAVWFMNGTSYVSSQIIATPPNSWKLVATGDLNGDGKPDILWQNISTGDVAVWLMNGTTVLSKSVIGNENIADWRIVGTGDFNGDGQTDILWQNPVNGKVLVWLMNGTTRVSSQLIGTESDLSWKIVGAGDFNGDGKPDILWQNTSSGAIAVWFMNGTTLVSSKLIATEANTSWQIRNK